MQDWVGWFVALMTLFIPFVDRAVFSRPLLFLVVSCSVFLHNFISFYSFYVSPVPSAVGDAVTFHVVAAEYWQANDWWTYYGSSHFYTAMLNQLYQYLGPSMLLAQEMSVLFYCIGLLWLVRTTILMGYKRHITIVAALYGLLPGPAMWHSVALREAYQSTFLIGMVMFCLLLRRSRNILYLIPMAGCAIASASLHQGLLIVILLFLPVFTFWAFNEFPRKLRIIVQLVGFVAAFAMLSFFVVVSISTVRSSLVGMFTSGGVEMLVEYSDSYGAGPSNSRTDYPLRNDYSSPIRFLAFLPLTFLQYMISVYPFQVRNASDLYSFLEGVLRLLLVWGSWSAIMRWPLARKNGSLLFFLLAIVLELVWNAGTSNWGTAVRHHVVAWPLFILTGTSYVVDKLLPSSKRRPRKRNSGLSPSTPSS